MDAREELKIAAGFVIDQVRAGRLFFDALDALLILAVTHANVEAIMRRPDLQNAFAGYDTPPPDALRRPISIHALAMSLQLPFETVRRRTRRLVRLGVLRTDMRGLWTPSSRVLGLVHRGTLELAYARIETLYARLGWGEATGIPPPPTLKGGWPLRAAARLSAEYLLRLVERLTIEVGDVVDATIWLEALRAGGSSGSGLLRGQQDGPRMAPLAKRLGFSTETLRRRVAHLAARGLVAWTPRGLAVVEEVFERPGIVQMAERHSADLRRMYVGLAQLQPPAALRRGLAA